MEKEKKKYVVNYFVSMHAVPASSSDGFYI